MSRSAYLRCNGRRRGQALLLAVLVMVFAALIGVTFITVVAINIGQTGREEERDKARQAAQAGLAFANLQLTNSILATKWRPEKEVQSAVPTPVRLGPPPNNNPFYWTPFDQAQGWAGYNGTCDATTDPCEGNFVKFPDPRSTNPSFNAPNYMVKVEKVGTDPLKDADNVNKDKTGALRITTIGLSPDDPTSFYKIVAYKAGPAQSPLTGAMRSVSNWNFQDKAVPTAEASGSGSASDTTMTLKNLSASFPARNFYVVIGNPGGTLKNAFVTAATGTSLTFATAPGGWTDGEHVEIATTLGAPRALALDYNRDGTVDTTAEQVTLDVSDSDAATPTPGSSWINGSLILSGNTLLQNLRAPQQASTTVSSGSVRTSGLIQVLNPNAAKVSGIFSDGAPSGIQSLLDSSNGNFPFAGSDARALDIVSDGANRIANSPDPERQNKPFTPPNIAAGGNGFGRYRQLSKYSPATNSALPQSSAYGFGEGIYLNNFQDRERKATTTAGVFTDMTQDDLIDLWYRSDADTANRALRLSEPLPTTSPNASLEEMHLRGWVSPNEFVPRGAQVELDPTNSGGPKIHITLENRNDGQAVVNTNNDRAYQGPVPTQGWRNPDGTLEGQAGDQGGVYHKTLDWPKNGVIFAEGNIRIRGGAFNNDGTPNTSFTHADLKSLTVVSMQNIYIEGSLNAGQHKVILLAKKNQIVNPSAVVAVADAKTWLSNASDPGSDTINVHDAGAFHAGEFITIGAAGLRRRIVAVNASAGTLQLDEAPTANPAGAPVRLITDPLRNDTHAYHQFATRLSRFNDALQRRVYLPGTPTEMRLAFRHSAERREALEITTQQALAGDPSNPPQLTAATMVNKLAANGADRETTIIQPTDTAGTPVPGDDKLLHIDYTDTATNGTDDFPQAAHTTETAAITYRIGEATDSDTSSSSDDLAEDLNERRRTPTPVWKYVANILNNYGSSNGTVQVPPAHFLAAVGNRSDINPATAPGAYPMRKNVLDGSTYKIPLATSVVLRLNGAQSALQSDRYSTALSGFEGVKQFGFNPTYGAGTARSIDNWEDVLTSDQSFYRNGTAPDTDVTYDNTYYTLDSRVIPTGVLGGWNSFALELNQLARPYFDATIPPGAFPRIPYYRLSRLKLENAGQLNAQHEFQNLAPGYTLDIRAFVYAQEGSWHVLPGDYFDDKIRTDTAYGVYQDLNDDGDRTGEDGETADLNGDGRVSRAEQVAAYRFLRYNYQVNFTGAIMEQKSATIDDPDGTGKLTGQVADWTDKWATVTLSDVNWSGTGPTDTLQTSGVKFTTIRYTFDPDAAKIGSPLDADEGFHPPVTPELMYQTG